MSTIKVNSIEPANAGSEDYFLARAWVNFNGSGTVSVRDSGNVTSITDNGTGDWTLNFTNAFGASDYSVVGSAEYTPTVTALSVVTLRTYATSSVTINTSNSANGARTDPTLVSVLAHGDLA